MVCKFATAITTAIAFIFSIANSASANQFEAAVKELAAELATTLQQKNADQIVPRFIGMKGMRGGATVGFTELLKIELAPLGILVSSDAPYELIATLERYDEGPTTSALLVGRLFRNGVTIEPQLAAASLITDGAVLAQYAGITTHFGPVDDDRKRALSFKKIIEDPAPQLFRRADMKQVASNAQAEFGVSIRSGSEELTIDNIDKVEPINVGYVDLKKGQDYSVVLTNRTNQEVVAELMIDGLNSLYFADASFIRADGQKYRYHVIAPKSTVEIRGWTMSAQRQTRFKISPMAESAVALAGAPADDVGLITATFYASWSKTPPRDEPTVRKLKIETYTVNVPVTKSVERAYTVQVPYTEEQAYTVNGPNGPETRTRSVTKTRAETRTRQETVTVMNTETLTKEVIATGFGTDEIRSTEGVIRVIGVPRATIAVRYGR